MNGKGSLYHCTRRRFRFIDGDSIAKDLIDPRFRDAGRGGRDSVASNLVSRIPNSLQAFALISPSSCPPRPATCKSITRSEETDPCREPYFVGKLCCAVYGINAISVNWN